MSVYAIVWAYEQDVSNSGAKFTLVTAAQYCNDQGICWVKQETLAEDMSMDRRSVMRHLDKLENDYKLIERKERRRKDGTRASDLIQLVGFRKVTKSRSASNQGDKNDAYQGDNLSQQETSYKETLVNSSKDEDGFAEASPSQASPGTFVAYLREELDGADVPLLRNREDRYAGEFNKLIKKGISDDVLYKASDRIVARWRGDEHRKLTAEQALEDVVNGKPPHHVGGSPDRLSASQRKAGYEWLFEGEPAKERDLGAELSEWREGA